MSSSTEYIFGSDRHHGRATVQDQGGTLISAGDLIDRKQEYDSEEALEAALRTELDKISENYDEAIVVSGNHDTTAYPMEGADDYDVSILDVAEDYEDINVVDSPEGERVEAEETGLEHDLVLGSSHQDRTAIEKYYLEGAESVEAMAFYEEEELEEAGSELEKEPEEVTLGDMEMLLEEQPQEPEEETGQTETNQGIDSYVRDVLTSIPIAGDRIFEPIYSKVDEIKNEYFEGETEEDEQNEEETGYDVSFEKSEIHGELEEQAPEIVEEAIESMVEKIDESENPVIFVDHGEPNTEDGSEYTSLINREVIERADNAEYMLTGHIHGEMNKEIAGTKVRNPGQGYYAGLDSFKQGESTDYIDVEFPAEEIDERTPDPEEVEASASDEEGAAA